MIERFVQLRTVILLSSSTNSASSECPCFGLVCLGLVRLFNDASLKSPQENQGILRLQHTVVGWLVGWLVGAKFVELRGRGLP